MNLDNSIILGDVRIVLVLAIPLSAIEHERHSHHCDLAATQAICAHWVRCWEGGAEAVTTTTAVVQWWRTGPGSISRCLLVVLDVEAHIALVKAFEKCSRHILALPNNEAPHLL